MQSKKIVYVSNVCSEKKLEQLFEGKYDGVPQQIQRYHRILIGGLAKRQNVEVEVLSALPVTPGNCRLKKIPGEKIQNGDVNYHYLATKNAKIAKRLGDLLGGFFGVLFQRGKRKDTIVIVDILDVSVVLGALIASKIRGFHSIGIVTDLPDFLFVIGRLHAKLANFNIRCSDAYILLTEQMNEIINPDFSKPYLVMEGHVPTSAEMGEYAKSPEWVCFYAGTLDERYGVKDLVEGFLKAELPNARLDIYGEGNFKEELIELSKVHENVCYQGVRSNREIVIEEKKASLLINPRPSHEEFVKYSFPSKNMEYLVSGTPVLSTWLPGMPKEYKDYMYVIKDESADGIAHALKEVFSYTETQRSQMASRAKSFVLKEKSENAQAEKVEMFIRSIYDESI